MKTVTLSDLDSVDRDLVSRPMVDIHPDYLQGIANTARLWHQARPLLERMREYLDRPAELHRDISVLLEQAKPNG